MHRYSPRHSHHYSHRTPRIAIAAAAVAMAALCIATLVGAPAALDGNQAAAALAGNATPPTQVAIVPGRIDVVGLRPAVAELADASMKRTGRP